jgi:hypothetical protein
MTWLRMIGKVTVMPDFAYSMIAWRAGDLSEGRARMGSSGEEVWSTGVKRIVLGRSSTGIHNLKKPQVRTDTP